MSSEPGHLFIGYASSLCAPRFAVRPHPRGVRALLGEGGAPKGLRDADEDGPLSGVARRAGLDPEEVLEVAAAPEAKEALKAATGEALGRGVFGAPAFFVGDEMFWGNDRLHFVEAALERG